MNDQAKYTVTLEFETSGADAEINNLRKLQEAVDGVAREGGIGEQSQVKLSKALHNTGVAAGDASSGIRRSEESIISLRYANYDLASTLFATSAAITAVGAASLTAFASQERAFTDVERTLQTNVLPEQVAEIEEALKSLSTQIPLTFNQLSEIATIGNQMGIEADNIVDFTNTIARFSAITGISIESTTKAFGGFMAQTGMAPELLENLGSAIAKVGIDSNATEEQILSLMREITAGATGAGFAAEQIVALSGTLASLQIAPERARGALTTYFETLNKAVASGGKALQDFAQVVGVPADELERMVRAGEGNKVLRGFLEGLQDLDSIDTTRALDDLGLAQLRVTDTFRRLSGSLQLYDRDQQNANTAFQQSTELQRQYAMIVDDLASKFQILLNALMNFGAEVGSVLAPAFGQLIDFTVGALKALTDFAQSPVGEALVRVTSVIAGALAVWAALRGAIALATASAFAFQFVLRGLGGAGIGAALTGMIKAFAGIKTTADGATTSTLTLAGAVRTLLRATIVGAALGALAEIIFNTGQAAINAGNAIVWLAESTYKVMQAIGNFLGGINSVFGQPFAALGLALENSPITSFIKDVGNNLKSWGASQQTVESLGGAVGDLGSAMVDLGDGSDYASGGIGDVGNAAAAATKQIRTLVDYAGDLSGVWQRAFDIRFGGGQGLDAIRTTFLAIRDAADEAAKRILDLKNDISGLSSDIDIQEYFLSIAVEYGDTKRAAAIEADLAKKRADLADKTAELQKQQDATSTSLVGTSKGAIDNRKQILDLVSQYQSYLQVLASSGLSQGALAAKSEQLRQEFISQATGLGYNRDELRLFEAAFVDTARIISAVPFGVTTDLSSLDPALLAIREFVDNANNELNTLGSGMGGALGGAFGGLPEEVAPVAEESAGRTASDYNDAYESFLDRQLGNSTVSAMGTAETQSRPVGTKWGAAIGGTLLSGSEGVTRTGFADTLNSSLTNAWYGANTTAATVGSWIGGAIRNGLGFALDTTLGGADSAARRAVRNILGFESGGYTGAGGKNEPAGIVHRGEYVIPKHMVNQSTGLPYADALGRMMTGVQGFTSGGAVGSRGSSVGTQTVALSPGTIQALAQAVQPYLVLDKKIIADASAQSYANDTTVGAY